MESGRYRVVLLALTGAGCTSLPGTLDAHFVFAEETSHAGVGGTTERGQTFTVESAGRLVQLDIWATAATARVPLDVQIVSLDDQGNLTGVVLVEGSVPAQSLLDEPLWLIATFPGGAPVSAGDRLAWLVSAGTEEDWNYGLLGADVDEDGQPYAGGNPCDRVVDNYDWSCTGDSTDFGFRLWLDSET